jgi:hypothetical protein
MTAFSDWLVDKAALLLDPDERDVVRGDLAETGESGARAVGDVLGLVVRRQAALWASWRAWGALLLVVIPVGMLLSLVSRLWADGTSVDAWVYLGHWDWSFLKYPGLRADLLRVLFLTLRDHVALICWSWTCGFAIASLSRRTAGVNALVFCTLLFAGTLGSSTTMRADSRVFATAFFRLVMPLLVRAFLVALPAIGGMRRALSREKMSLKTALLWTFAIATITVANHTAVEESASFFGWRPFGPMPDPGFDRNLGTDDDVIDWKLRFLPLVVMWPAVYLLARTSVDHFTRQWRKA